MKFGLRDLYDGEKTVALFRMNVKLSVSGIIDTTKLNSPEICNTYSLLYIIVQTSISLAYIS